MVKSSPANIGDIKDLGLILGLERCSGEGHGNPLQYSWPENPMDRGACQATVHGVAESDTTEHINHHHHAIFLGFPGNSAGKNLLAMQETPA